MDLRLTFLNLWLRLTVKPVLRRLNDPKRMRALLERDAKRFFAIPDGATFADATIPVNDRPPGTAQMPAVWASVGTPDRRKVILYLHGGAYIAGSPRTHRHLAAALAGSAGARAIVPDYRLAPEDPFPAGLEDAVATYRHLLEAGNQGADIALAGDSAGGGLAFATLLALEQRDLPAPGCVVGFSPWADMTGQADSIRRNASRDVILPANRMDEAVQFYLGEAGRETPTASPALAEWRSPPPALIMASDAEILLDDAKMLADGLRRGGGDVHLEIWPGLPHAWQIFCGRLRQADAAIEGAGKFIARHLGVMPER
ncbi:MAG: alpha/beta hydrolase [Pseudomonadota bacterium]